MKKIEVHKFGGTSVADADRVRNAAALLLAAREGGNGIVGVSSAMGGVTNSLLAAAEAARSGDRAGADEIIGGLRVRHDEALNALGDAPAELAGQLHAIFDEATELLHGTAMLRELTPRVGDRLVVTGEKLAVRLLAHALRLAGADAEALDADTFLRTTARFGQADPLSYTDCPGVAETLEPVLRRGAIPVVTGFCGRSAEGATTTFGRGGSDLTATLLAAAMRAERCVIWTDVAGAYTADPRVVSSAAPIPRLHPREASEMSFYGAKVLHPRTMIPVASLGIPVRIASSLEPEQPGTIIEATGVASSGPLRAITAVRNQSLISIEGNGMAGVPGIAGRVFDALAERSISVTMISQSSSESSVCFALPENDSAEADRALRKALRNELADGLVEDVRMRHGVALVAAVGIGMIHSPGVAGRVFGALGRNGVNVLAIAQGSSELNISLAVDAEDADRAIQTIHDEFFGPVLEGSRLDVAVRGFGNVGRRLAQLIAAYEPRLGEPDIRLVAVADSSGGVVVPDGLGGATLETLIRKKAGGSSLVQNKDGIALAEPSDLLGHIPAGAPTALADCTDDGAAADTWRLAFERRLDVVSANKDPFAADDAEYADLLDACARQGRILRGEATVGAGLPVIDTLDMLLATGDHVFAIDGALSGSIGFILSRVEEGASFVEAVAEARDLGYTEPDPAIDLCGGDVARKALILGRRSGLLRSKSQVTTEGIVDSSLIGAAPEELDAALSKASDDIAKRAEKAASAGQVLRFTMRVEPSRASIGLRAVDAGSALGSLRGTESLVSFTTERYRQQPLAVRGAGAGADVTASGVFADLIRVSAARCRPAPRRA